MISSRIQAFTFGSDHKVEDLVSLPEDAKFDDHILIKTNQDVYKRSKLSRDVVATNLVKALQESLPGKTGCLIVTQISDEKCHLYSDGDFMEKHRDRQVSPEHILTCIVSHPSPNKLLLYARGNPIEIPDGTFVCFNPRVEHEVPKVSGERKSYSFKIFGQMDWDVFLS